MNQNSADCEENVAFTGYTSLHIFVVLGSRSWCVVAPRMEYLIHPDFIV